MLEFAVELLLKSTVVLVLAGAFCSFPRLSAAERHNLATLGLAAVAGIAAMVWLTGNDAIPTWSIALPERPVQSTPVEVERPLHALVEAGVTASTAVQSLQHSPSLVNWWPWVLAAYLAVTLALGASTLAGRRRVARYVRRLPVHRLTTGDDPKGVDIRMDACATPWTWGIRRPVIVFPEDFGAWPRGRQDAAMAHELSHISRRDCLVDSLSRWLCNVFWFQPLVWVLWVRQRGYAEAACDDAVLAHGGDACDYAETLLAIARSNATARPMGIAVGSGALTMRLRTILRSDVRRNPMTRRKRGMLAGLAFAIIVSAGACSVGGGVENVGVQYIPQAVYAQELTQEEVVANERRLAETPDDILARTRLISHYAQRRYTGEAAERAHARQAHANHLAWIVGHAPNASVLGHAPHAFLTRRDAPEGYATVKEAWQSQLDAQPRNTVILDRFAKFLSFDESERAIGLLRKAQKLEPANPKWAEELGRSYLRLTNARGREAEFPSAPHDALAQYDTAYELYPQGEASFAALNGRANAAFVAKRYPLAKSHAEAMLVASETGGGNNIGDLVHRGHTLLGRIALIRGDVEQAKEHLLSSARTSGSAVLGSYGPSMRLAHGLVERGEFDVVAEYLELCSAFWKDERLDAWRTTVVAREIPDFGSSLHH